MIGHVPFIRTKSVERVRDRVIKLESDLELIKKHLGVDIETVYEHRKITETTKPQEKITDHEFENPCWCGCNGDEQLCAHYYDDGGRQCLKKKSDHQPQEKEKFIPTLGCNCEGCEEFFTKKKKQPQEKKLRGFVCTEDQGCVLIGHGEPQENITDHEFENPCWCGCNGDEQLCAHYYDDGGKQCLKKKSDHQPQEKCYYCKSHTQEMLRAGQKVCSNCKRYLEPQEKCENEQIEAEIQKVEQALASENNLNQVSFYEGYIKGLKFRNKLQTK